MITHDHEHNPNGRKVTDSMWNFAFRDEVRRLMRNELRTQWGQPSRRDRIQWAITGGAIWDDWNRSVNPGFADLSQAVNYLTSHDVEKEHEKRIMNYLFGQLLAYYGRTDGLVQNRAVVEHIKNVADHPTSDRHHPEVNDQDRYAHGEALERVRSAFALLLTSVGIPMILAGDEFGDVHDLDHTDWRLKMSDPVDWSRRTKSRNNMNLWENVRSLIELRKSHRALLRNGPNSSTSIRAPTRTTAKRCSPIAGRRASRWGTTARWSWWPMLAVRVTASFNCRGPGRIREIAPPTHRAEIEPSGAGSAKLSIAPFQARVFET